MRALPKIEEANACHWRTTPVLGPPGPSQHLAGRRARLLALCKIFEKRISFLLTTAKNCSLP